LIELLRVVWLDSGDKGEMTDWRRVWEKILWDVWRCMEWWWKIRWVGWEIYLVVNKKLFLGCCEWSRVLEYPMGNIQGLWGCCEVYGTSGRFAPGMAAIR